MKYLGSLVLCIFVLLVSKGQAQIKAGILTDIHINNEYHANITAESYCEKKENSKFTDVLAHLGRQGCDPPI